MNFPRNSVFLSALALTSLLASAGCNSGNQQASNAQPGSVNGQSSQSAQPATGSSASSSGSSPSSSSAPGSAPASAPAPQAPPPPTVIDLPSGTRIHVRLDQDLGSKISQPGDFFTATVADDVMVNGQTVIPRGARADGTVIDAKALGRFKGGALLEVRLDRVHTNWGSYPVASSTIDQVEKGKGKRTAEYTRRRRSIWRPDWRTCRRRQRRADRCTRRRRRRYGRQRFHRQQTDISPGRNPPDLSS